jgi:hypothetical protein
MDDPPRMRGADMVGSRSRRQQEDRDRKHQTVSLLRHLKEQPRSYR